MVGEEGAPQFNQQVLYCSAGEKNPEKEQLQRAFYNCNAANTKYLSGVWEQIENKDVPAGKKIHPLK